MSPVWKVNSDIFAPTKTAMTAHKKFQKKVLTSNTDLDLGIGFSIALIPPF